jgi:farnesyl-diphosphate farnesyltransferase
MDEWEHLKATSRTFYLSIKQLPGIVGEAMCLSYLLLRVSDFLEDNHYMTPKQKVDLLLLWERALTGIEPPERLVKTLSQREPGNDPDEILSHLADQILEKTHALPQPLQELMIHNIRKTTMGMARWIARGPLISKEEDMDDYMHEVAGRVGYLSTGIFAWYSPAIRKNIARLLPLARETGLALQTVNIIRGLRKDYERGWIYVPESFCNQVDLQRQDLFNPQYQDKALQVIDMLADKAERHLQSAMAYILSLPPWLHRIRLSCIWPMLFAVRTLALSRRNVDVLLGEVKMSREEVQRIVRDTTLWGWSNRWLSKYAKNLQAV